jgi:hypothetical protein
MAQVTGTIGTEPVELYNAATEQTLRELVTAIQKMGGDLAAQKASALASTAGINRAAQQLDQAGVSAENLAESNSKAYQAGEKVGETFGKLAKTVVKLDTAFAPFIGNLMKGTATSSELFGIFAKMGGIIGGVSTVFQRVAGFQEENLSTYQQISNSGATFGGSLTEMRQAASDTYLTLSEFTEIMKGSGETLVKMGGTAESGARAFTRVSNQLLKSEAGEGLRALGYSTKEVNEGLMNYINITGGRTREEMRNTANLTTAAAGYLEQLDGLSQLTGESRQQLQEKMKEDAANQAWQNYLLTLDEDTRNKANAAYTESMARGGKGAAQALMSQLMGLPPMTKEAQSFVGMAKQASSAVSNLANSVQDSTKSVDDVKRQGATITAGMANDARALGDTGKALIMQGGENAGLFGKLFGALNNATRNNIRTLEDQIEFEKSALAAAKIRKESEAADAVKAQQALQELGQSVMAGLLPAIKFLTPIVNELVIGFVSFGKLLVKNIETVGLLTAGFVALVAAVKAMKVVFAAKALVSGGGGAGGAGGAGGGVLGRTFAQLGTAANPMYVIVVGGRGGGGARGGGGGGARGGGGGGARGGAAPPTPSTGGKLAGVAKGGVAAIGGAAVGYAADYAKEQGYEKTGAGLDVASQALTWGGTGAMIGSVVPGIGTGIGAALGAGAGAVYGLFQNWDVVEKSISGLFSDAKNIATSLIPSQETISNAFSSLKNFASSLLPSQETISGAFSSLKNFASSLLPSQETISSTFSSLSGFASSLLPSQETISGAFSSLKNFASSLLPSKESISSTFSSLSGFASSLLPSQETISGAFSSLKNFASSLLPSKESISSTFSSLSGFAGALLPSTDTIKQKFSSAFSFVGNMFSGNKATPTAAATAAPSSPSLTANDVLTAVGGPIAAAIGPVSNFVKENSSVFSNLLSTLKTKLDDLPGKIGNKVATTTTAATAERIENPVLRTNESNVRALESLAEELKSLNRQTAEMIKYLRENVDYSKRTMDATIALNGDFFK